MSSRSLALLRWWPPAGARSRGPERGADCISTCTNMHRTKIRRLGIEHLIGINYAHFLVPWRLRFLGSWHGLGPAVANAIHHAAHQFPGNGDDWNGSPMAWRKKKRKENHIWITPSSSPCTEQCIAMEMANIQSKTIVLAWGPRCPSRILRNLKSNIIRRGIQTLFLILVLCFRDVPVGFLFFKRGYRTYCPDCTNIKEQ